MSQPTLRPSRAAGRRGSRSAAALLLGLVALSGFTAGPVAAQDEDESEEAAKPLVSMKVTDGDQMVELQLPGDWKINKDFEMPAKLGAWIGPLLPGDKGPTTLAAIQLNPDYRSAALAQSSRGPDDGEPIASETRTGAGFEERCYKPSKGNLKILWRRHVELDGNLFSLLLGTVHPELDDVRAAARSVLDSFQITSPPKQEELPKDWWQKSSKGVVIWSDESDKKIVDQTADYVETSAKMLAKALPGKSFDTAPLRIKFYAQASDYNDACKKAFGSEPDTAGFSYADNTLLVKGLRHSVGDFPDDIYRVSADGHVRRYFGGRIPTWLRFGLVQYAQFAALSGGKPKKLDKRFSDLGRTAAQTSRQLDTWFTTDWARSGDTDKSQREVFAWVWYLYHGKAPKGAGSAFEKYLKILRETGDEPKARLAWKGIDFPALHEAFKSSADKW